MIREAQLGDIAAMQRIRNAVKENVLSDPGYIKDADYTVLIEGKGKGWVFESGQDMAGFAFADVENQNIWALFVHPGHEGKGVGRALHDAMLDWYFSAGEDFAWLTTAPGTRAAVFYKKAGWRNKGLQGNEIRFEMTAADWR